MGWTPHYQLLRDRPLSEAEIASIAELVRAQRKLPWDSETFHVSVARSARPDRVVAAGITKIAMSDESNDAAMLMAAVNALLALVPGSELRIWDDFNMFGWDPREGCVDNGKPTVAPVEVPYGELVDPQTIVPAAPAQLGDFAASDTATLVGLLADLDGKDPRLQELKDTLKRRDAREVAVAIYASYATHGRNMEVRHVLDHALERLPDRASVAHEFLTAWRNGEGTYFYGDMPLPGAFRDAVAGVPEVAAQMIEDVRAIEGAGDADLPYRRAEVAIDLISRDRSDRGLRAMLEIVRTHRGKNLPWRVVSYVFENVHGRLGERGDRRAAPTLLHFLGTMKRFMRSHGAALAGLVRIDPESARPHVLTLAASGGQSEVMVSVLAALGGADTIAPLEKLAQHPRKHIAEAAAAALRKLGVEPAARIERTHEELATHPDQYDRHEALRKIADRKDKSTFLSLVAAEALDRHLRHRTDDGSLPFSWWDWKAVLPEDVIKMNETQKKLTWAEGPGKELLGEQVIWPSIERIRREGAAKVVADYPSQLLSLPRAALAALVAEEDRVFVAVGGVLPEKEPPPPNPWG